MAETDAPMFQSTRSMEDQMDEILTEEKDPVSGNTAPVGAKPEEVRDDIPIMASPNEFMIDAATRRYYGTEFFEGLQDAAKQGFQRIKKGEESFFRDDELEIEEEAQKMFEGGEVEDKQEELKQNLASGTSGYGGTGAMFLGFEFKTYVHPTKPDIQISFFNGRPLRPIPEGYTFWGEGSRGITDLAGDKDYGVQNTEAFFSWINEFILNPSTTAAIALQEPPEDEEVNYIERIQGGAGDSIFEEEEIVE